MNIINVGDIYTIYGDGVKTHKELPAQTYRVEFSKNSGFFLQSISDFENKEEKIYGNHLTKIEKVLKTYDVFERSLGIILSGNKGMGKSLFVQLMATEAIKKGLPVIIVTKPYNGIADFIDSIEQEAVVIFDEFEKMFSKDAASSNGGENQGALLGLFDGVSQQKRLYAITVNDIYKVNEFILNRPGRFHYHMRFDYPSVEETTAYLQDKILPEYHGQIEKVINFSRKVNLNFDSLRAIAFEINSGYTFAEAISDMNIKRTETTKYDLSIELSTGEITTANGQNLDLFGEHAHFERNFNILGGQRYASLKFDPTNSNVVDENVVISGDTVDFGIYYDDDEEEKYGNITVKSILIKPTPTKSYSYAV